MQRGIGSGERHGEATLYQWGRPAMTAPAESNRSTAVDGNMRRNDGTHVNDWLGEMLPTTTKPGAR
jgi:hypothetical protein